MICSISQFVQEIEQETNSMFYFYIILLMFLPVIDTSMDRFLVIAHIIM
jgi:hypothetical protein